MRLSTWTQLALFAAYVAGSYGVMRYESGAAGVVMVISVALLVVSLEKGVRKCD